MGVCDAHEAVLGRRGTIASGEGYLLGASFMQNSKVQDKNIDIHIALYKQLGRSMSREEAKLEMESVQGATPWLICEECADFLRLSNVDKNAAREAAKKWWKDKSTPGHIPGQKMMERNKKPAYFMIFGNGFTPSEVQAHFILRAWVNKVEDILGKDVWEHIRMELRIRDRASTEEFIKVVPEVKKAHLGQLVDDILMLDKKNGQDMVLIAVWAPEDSEYVSSLLKSKKDKSDKTDEEKTEHGLKRGEGKDRQEQASATLGQMEYPDGYNLEDRIFDYGAMSKTEAFKIFKQIMADLDYAHSQNVFHGNIKPANILVSKDGKAKLADFDTTQLISKSTYRATCEKIGKDSLYLAPEQLSSNNPSLKGDIYSLAVSIYECIYGHQAFWERSLKSQFVNGKPAHIQKLNNKQNEALLKALCKNPDARQDNAKELLNDLWPEATELTKMQKVTSEHKESAILPQKEPKAKNRLKIVIPLLSILLCLTMGIGILNWQRQMNKKKDHKCADIYRNNFWQKALLDPPSSARLLDRIQRSSEVYDLEVINYMRKLRMNSDIFLKVPDRSWTDFSYRHGRIPVIGQKSKCVLTVDTKEQVIDSKQYGFISITVKQKRYIATLTVKDNNEIICSKDFVDTDPPLPYSITVRTMNGIPVGYQGYHTANAVNVINQAKNHQIPLIKRSCDSLSKTSIVEREEDAFSGACYYLITGKASLGCKKLRHVIKNFPKSEFATEAAQILNSFSGYASPIRLSEGSPEYKDTIGKFDRPTESSSNLAIANKVQTKKQKWHNIPNADEVWQNIQHLAKEKNYDSAIDKAEVFINTFPDNIYAGKLREQLLLWKRIVVKPKIDVLLSKATSSKNNGDFEKALEYVLSLLNLDPDCSEAKTLQTEIESLREAQRIAVEKEKRFNDLKNKAFSFETEKNWESAIKTYQEALLVREGDQEVKNILSTCWHNLYVAKAKTAESQGDLNAAIDSYIKALAQKQVDSTENRLELVKRKMQAEADKERREKELAKWLSKAQDSEKDGNLSEAIQFYEQAQEHTDISFKEKIDSLRDKVTEKKKFSEFNELFEHAKVTSNQNLDRALEVLEKALELYPNNVEVLELKKQISEKRKQIESKKLVDDTRKALQTLKKNETIYTNRGHVLKPPEKVQVVMPAPVDFYKKLTLTGHNGWITSAAFSPKGDRIVSGSFDLTVRIWDTRSGKCLKTLRGHNQLVQAVAFSPDGRHIASGDGWNHTLKIWNAWTGACLHTIKAHSGDIHDLSFSFDGKFVASAGDDKLVKIWNVNTGDRVKILKGHSNGVFCVEFSPVGEHIASGSWDKKIKIWDLASGQCIRTLKGHRGTVESLSFSPDGSRIASCDYWDGKIIIWDALNGDQLRKMSGEKGFHAVAFSPDGNYIVSGNADGKIQTWNAETGVCLKTTKAHGGFPSLINSVEFSPDGSHILSAGNDKRIKVWSLQ